MKNFGKSLFAFAMVFLVSACAGPHDLVVLLADADGKVGVVTVEGTDGTKVVLDSALASARVGAGDPEKTVTSEDQVNILFKEALAAQPPDPVSFILYFEAGETVLTEASKAVQEKLFEAVAARQVVEIQVTGHTDRQGTRRNNDKLALSRAQAVAKKLVELGIKTKRVRAVGRGEREPLVQTADGKREARNRRVEVIVR
jgi:OOP family OmpA-OmpF porin